MDIAQLSKKRFRITNDGSAETKLTFDNETHEEIDTQNKKQNTFDSLSDQMYCDLVTCWKYRSSYCSGHCEDHCAIICYRVPANVWYSLGSK
jgi:hypothetical protein